MAENGPYATIKTLLGTLPKWIADKDEGSRVASYSLYEAIYWTVPETFKLVSRGTEDKPIYLPSGRIIVETLHRYLANDLNVINDATFISAEGQAAATPESGLLANQVWTDFTRRERFYSKFQANKRFGIIRGDWMFHLYADPAQLPGSKVSIFPLDPGRTFPIYNPENVDEIIGWHIVDFGKEPKSGKEAIKRLTYRKTTGVGGPSLSPTRS